MTLTPFLPRLLEQSNDVEKNPGPLPHRLIRPGFGSNGHCNNVVNKKNKHRDNSEVNNSDSMKDNTEDLKTIIEKQSDQIQKQNEEIKFLKQKVDENEKLVTDFRSELSEVRKKWQSMGDLRNG